MSYEQMKSFKRIRIKSQLAREVLAEFAGTFILLAFGEGSVAQAIVSNGTQGSTFSINWGYAIGVILGVYTSGGISGGHINPAVTLAFAVTKKFPWRKVPFYFLGQYLGAIAASLVVFLVYYDAIQNFTGGVLTVQGPNATAGIFATYPAEGIRLGTGFLDQIVGTALLLFCVRAISDCKNMSVPKHLSPILVGLVVLGMGVSFGFNAGYAINPARDFGPRLFTLMCGYGPEVFSAYNYWFYIPLLAPHFGGILGSILYDLFVEIHWPEEEDSDGTQLHFDITNKTLESSSILGKEEKS